jgi:putative transposase
MLHSDDRPLIGPVLLHLADDAVVRQRLRAVAALRRRFGCRRLQIMLTWEGLVMNHKKFRRLYREE